MWRVLKGFAALMCEKKMNESTHLLKDCLIRRCVRTNGVGGANVLSQRSLLSFKHTPG